MNRRRNDKTWWYRWNDHAFKPIILWRVAFFVLSGLVVIGLFTYETFPYIFPATAILVLIVLVFLLTRHFLRVFIYWLHGRKSRRGQVVLTYLPQKWLDEFVSRPVEQVVDEETQSG